MVHSNTVRSKTPESFSDILRYKWVLSHYHIFSGWTSVPLAPNCCSLLICRITSYSCPKKCALCVFQFTCHVNSMLSLHLFSTPNKVLLSIGRKLRKKGTHSPWLYVSNKLNLASLLIMSYKQSCLNQTTKKKSEKSEDSSRTTTHYFSSSSAAAENICTKTFLIYESFLTTSLAYVDKQGKHALQNHCQCNLHETEHTAAVPQELFKKERGPSKRTLYWIGRSPMQADIKTLPTLKG